MMFNRVLMGSYLFVLSLSVIAAPAFLLTHNQTDVESNAFIVTQDGRAIPSIYPTKPHSDSKVYWNMVKLACHGHAVGSVCRAVIKMGTNTPYPVDVGEVAMDLVTGEITPKQLSANGYTFIVNGLGEITLTQP